MGADRQRAQRKGGAVRRNDRARPPARRRAEGVRRLQETAGNQAVLRMIQAASAESRLRIGPRSDRYEKEAESIADSTVRRAAEEKTGEARARSASDSPEIDVQKTDAAADSETVDRAVEATEVDRESEIRRAPEMGAQDEEVRRDPVSSDEDVARRQGEIHEDEEPKGGGVRRAASEEEEPVRRKASEPGRRARMEHAAARAVRDRGPGEALDRRTRRTLESSLGADLGAVRVHRDARAQEAAKTLRAKAFTHRNHIWLAAGQSPRDLRLMAHEAAHVVQQGAAGRKPGRPRGQAPVQRQTEAGEETVQRDAAPEPAATAPGDAVVGDVAPGEVELKGRPGFEPGPAVAEWLEQRPGKKKGPVRVRFGELAKGTVEVEKRKQGYRIPQKGIPLRHPVLDRVGEVLPAARPMLVLSSEGKGLRGHVGLQTGKAVPKKAKALAGQIRKHADLLGLAGFQILEAPGITNRLEEGRLVVELTEAPIRLGQIFDGKLTVRAEDGAVTSFEGTVVVSVPGLATGPLDLARNDKGEVTGKTDLEVTLAKENLSGKVSVAWDGRAVEGEGTLGYQGEKLSGSITLNVMEKAAALEREKQATAGKETAAVPAAKKEKTGTKQRPGAGDYLLFGQGELDFQFTDWLTGKANVVVDPKGHTTIVGEITPQKEFELFPQKDYTKKLFKIEARASYGIPVVGNIFIFANIGMDAVAKLGPAKFYNIVVAGTYSTDPQKSQDFSIRGSLNISAFAGLRLRGEAGAGLEILGHDIKAGAGINALAGIRGYAEATPIIGYREKPAAEGADKKGEFFIRGDLEIAAQPFLGLSGDLFVEIDAPWWSPVPDKKWTWPLGGREYPLGGTFGLGASVDYVFGSGKAPALDFKPVEFSSDKFLTDLYSDKAKSKSGKKEAPGKWQEKNAKAAEPPAKEPAKGAAKEGKAGELPAAKSKVSPGGQKKARKAVDPKARTAEGKSVKQLEADARKKGKKPEPKGPKKGTGKEQPRSDEAAKKKHDAELQKGLAALRAVTKRYAAAGATKEEIKTGAKSVRRKFKVFKSIEIIDGGETWDYQYVADPGKQTGPKKKVVAEYLGARRVGSSKLFEGRFDHPDWSWKDVAGEGDYPAGSVTRHPINRELGFRQSAKSPRPPKNREYRSGGRTGGLPKVFEDSVKAWRNRHEETREQRRQELLDEYGGKANNVAKREIEDSYVNQGYPRIPFQHLLVYGSKPTDRWEAHHIHEASWDGSDRASNLQYLPKPEHQEYTNWWERRSKAIKSKLEIT